MIVGKRVFCVWYAEDCVSAPRGSGVRMLFAECDPLLPPAGVVLPASLCASLCAPILVNPLLDERVSGVPEEPELHLKIYVRSVSDGMWSPWTSPVWHVRSPSWMVVPETSFGESPPAGQGTAPLAQCKLSSGICDFGALCHWPEATCCKAGLRG